MNVAQNNIIGAMEFNIFEGTVDKKIKSEVSFFRNILLENYNNPEVFHGYVNKLNEVWNSILTYGFKRLVAVYNREYEYLIYKNTRRQEEMLKMATDMAAEDMLEDLSELGVSANMASLIKGVKKTGITKKGPSKKKSKK